MKSVIRDVLDIFHALDIEVTNIDRTGKGHYRVYVTDGSKGRAFVTPSSPSDHRGLKNFRSDVKRWLKSSPA